MFTYTEASTSQEAGLCNQYSATAPLEEIGTTPSHVGSPGGPHDTTLGMPLSPALWWADGRCAELGGPSLSVVLGRWVYYLLKHAHPQLNTQSPAVWPVDKQAALKGTVFHVSCCSVNSHWRLNPSVEPHLDFFFLFLFFFLLVLPAPGLLFISE